MLCFDSCTNYFGWFIDLGSSFFSDAFLDGCLEDEECAS